jgi:hypothetical protein
MRARVAARGGEGGERAGCAGLVTGPAHTGEREEGRGELAQAKGERAGRLLALFLSPSFLFLFYTQTIQTNI